MFVCISYSYIVIVSDLPSSSSLLVVLFQFVSHILFSPRPSSQLHLSSLFLPFLSLPLIFISLSSLFLPFLSLPLIYISLYYLSLPFLSPLSFPLLFLSLLLCVLSLLSSLLRSPPVSRLLYTPLRLFYSNIPFSVVFSSRAEQAGAGACNDNRFRSSQVKNIKDSLWRDDDFSTAIVMVALYATLHHSFLIVMDALYATLYHSLLDRSSQ